MKKVIMYVGIIMITFVAALATAIAANCAIDAIYMNTSILDSIYCSEFSIICMSVVGTFVAVRVCDAMCLVCNKSK